MTPTSAKRSRPIGRYHLLDRVACGGMAEVYRAKAFEPDGTVQLVALKKVLEMYAGDASFLKMLVAEYHLSALLAHPNIAAIYELLRAPEGYFIAMEYVDGKDLRATLARAHDEDRRFEVADAVYLMARALDGLHYAHTATTDDGTPLNLVHRDFSPSNILVGYDGNVKIIDFGIAKASVPRDRTASGIIKGKVRYMSPEQANGDERLTGQSDVFSAGSVLYELLSGEPAFNAPNELELIYTVRRASPKPLAQIAPSVPEGLVEIVKTAMARSRRDRYRSAAEFRDALVTFLRAYAPGYRRTRIANFMKTLWASEIDEEISTLLEFAISDEAAVATENLLAYASVDESIEAAAQGLAVAAAVAAVVPAEPRPATPPARFAPDAHAAEHDNDELDDDGPATLPEDGLDDDGPTTVPASHARARDAAEAAAAARAAADLRDHGVAGAAGVRVPRPRSPRTAASAVMGAASRPPSSPSGVGGGGGGTGASGPEGEATKSQRKPTT